MFTASDFAVKRPESVASDGFITRRKLVPRSDGRQVRRLVAYFDPTLAKSLERWCVDHEMDVSGAIVEAVRRMLGEG